jgi:outer membrane lipoprotein LolB
MRRRLALLCCVAALSACARLPVGSDGMSLTQRTAVLGQYDSWDIRGRMAVNTGERAFPANFNWQQRGDALELLIRGPLGTGALRISGTPNALTVETRGESRTLDDPENDLSELVGWWLPVASLPAWLRGLPDPQYPATTTPGADGTLASLEQRLWRLDFVSYQLEENLLLPRRIDLSHGALELRVTIDTFTPAVRAARSLN